MLISNQKFLFYGSIFLLILLYNGCANKPLPLPVGSNAPTQGPSNGEQSKGSALEEGLKDPSSVKGSNSKAKQLSNKNDNPPAFTKKDSSDKKEFGRKYNKTELLDDIYFDFGQHSLTTLSKTSLDKNSSWLKENLKSEILIEGHCDERGTNNYNLGLGERRAQMIKTYLISLGISGRRISTISYGEEKPFCADHNESCWYKNRRGHFLLTSK